MKKTLLVLAMAILGLASVPAGATQGSTLIVYFSATGNTRALVGTLARATGAEVHEIVPSEPYTEADLNYHVKDCRANLEQRDASARPGFAGDSLDLGAYDLIVLAYPLWWGREPRIVDSFIERHDFSNRQVAAICTSGGSGIGQSLESIRGLLPASATLLGGRRFSPQSPSEELMAWLGILLKG